MKTPQDEKAMREKAWQELKAPANETITSRWYFEQGYKAAMACRVVLPSPAMLDLFFEEANEEDCATGKGLWQCFHDRLSSNLRTGENTSVTLPKGITSERNGASYSFGYNECLAEIKVLNPNVKWRENE